MADQLFTDGDVKVIDDREFECVGVAYTEVDGVRSNYTYHLQLKSDMDARREAERIAQEEAAEAARLTEEMNKPVEGEQ